MDFTMDFYVFCIFFINVFILIFTNISFIKCCFIQDILSAHFGNKLCLIQGPVFFCSGQEINPEARPYGFKNLYVPQKKPATVTRQLKLSKDFRENYVCDSHLRTELSFFSYLATKIPSAFVPMPFMNEVSSSFLLLQKGNPTASSYITIVG